MVENTKYRAVLYTSPGICHTRCEDFAAAACGKNGNFSAALSDGMGSAAYPAEGAETVAKTGAEFFSLYLDRILNDELSDDAIADGYLEFLRKKLLIRSAEIGCDIGDLSSTSITLGLLPDKQRGVVCQVGDGIVIGLKNNGGAEVISRYLHERYVNQTEFVTSVEPKTIIKKIDSEYVAFLLVSDGPEPFFIMSDGSVNTYVKKLLTTAFFMTDEELLSELEREDFALRKKGMTDDSSYVIVLSQSKEDIAEIRKQLPPELRASSRLSAEGENKEE